MRWNGYGTAMELSTAAPKTTPLALQDGGTEWHIAPVSDRDTLVLNYYNVSCCVEWSRQPIGLQCVYVRLCLCMSVFELNDLPPRYLARWFIITPSRSSSKVKITGQSLKNEENKSLATAKMANLCRKGDLNWKLQVSNSRENIF